MGNDSLLSAYDTNCTVCKGIINYEKIPCDCEAVTGYFQGLVASGQPEGRIPAGWLIL